MLTVNYFPERLRGQVSDDALCIASLRGALYDAGLRILQEPEHVAAPDAVWAHYDYLPQAREFGRPIILDDQTDTGFLFQRVREWIADGGHVIKRCIYRNLAVYNEPFQGDCYQSRLLDVDLPYASLPPTLREGKICNQLHVGLNYACWPRLQPLRERGGYDERPIDVFFAGTMDYGWPFVAEHRRKCVEAIEALPAGITREVHRGRVLSAHDYFEKLRQSKIVVSPWGFGAMCHRDFEAIYAGALLFKPYSAWLRTWPDIFAAPIQDTVCDWSRCRDLIAGCLESWDAWSVHAAAVRQRRLDDVAPARCAAHLAEVFHACLG